MLKQTYLVPTQDVGARLPMQRHGWHEYGNYIGLGSAIAIVIGLCARAVRAARAREPIDWFGVSLAVTTVFLFLLSLGEFGRVRAGGAVAAPAAVLEFPDSEPLHDPVPAICRADAGMGVPIGAERVTAFRGHARSRLAIVAARRIGALDRRQPMELARACSPNRRSTRRSTGWRAAADRHAGRRPAPTRRDRRCCARLMEDRVVLHLL